MPFFSKNVLGPFLCLLLVVLLLVGCSKDTPSETSPSSGEKTEETKERVPLPLDPLLETLSQNLYSVSPDEDYSDMYGLHDTQIGVDQERFENEMLYPFPDDSEFSKIIYMSERGFSEKAGGATNLTVVNQVLAEAQRTSGKVKIVFPDGTFSMTQGIGIGDCQDLYICSEGTTRLILDKYTSVFLITRCENIHVTGFYGTYKDPGVISGVIDAFDEATATVTVTIDKSIKMASTNYPKEGGSLSGYYEMTLNPSDGRYYYDSDNKNARYVWGDTWEKAGVFSNTVYVHFKNGYRHTPVVGDKVMLMTQQYGTNAYNIEWSKNIYLENCSCSSTCGMATVATSSENLYFNRLRVEPDIENGIYMSSCADGIHTVCITGDLVLTNCLVDGCQDDCINVCTSYDYVKTADGNQITYTSNNTNFAVGQTLELYDPETFDFYGSYRVTEYAQSKLTLDRAVDSRVKLGCIIANISRATHLTIDNCMFINSYGRGGLIQTRDTVIKNSTFSHLIFCGLKIHSCNDVYKEGVVPRNVTVENCKFINCNQMPYFDSVIEVLTYVYKTKAATPGIVKEVTIKNNAILHTAGNAISLYGAGDCRIENNLFYDLFNKDGYFQPESFILSDAAVGIRYSRDITLTRNYLYMPDQNSNLNMVDYQEANCTNIVSKDN